MKTKLEPDEKILYQSRKHWIVYVPAVIIAGALIAAGVYMKTILFAVVGILVFIYVHVERKRNIWIVTNKRFIDEWGVISINTKETPLDKINNVSFKKDPAGIIFGYGSIMIQSAAEMGATWAKFVPQPEMLVQVIAQAQSVFRSIPPDSMECPVCKEIIKKGALKCRFCGTEFVSQGNTFVEEPERQKTQYKVAESNIINEQNTNQIINDNKEKENKEIYERRGQVWRPSKE